MRSGRRGGGEEVQVRAPLRHGALAEGSVVSIRCRSVPFGAVRCHSVPFGAVRCRSASAAAVVLFDCASRYLLMLVSSGTSHHGQPARGTSPRGGLDEGRRQRGREPCHPCDLLAVASPATERDGCNARSDEAASPWSRVQQKRAEQNRRAFAPPSHLGASWGPGPRPHARPSERADDKGPTRGPTGFV